MDRKLIKVYLATFFTEVSLFQNITRSLVHVAQFLLNLLFTDANNRKKKGKAPKMDIIIVTGK